MYNVRLLAIATLLFASICASQSSAQQTVLLDFDSGSDGGIVYTQQMRDNVQAEMELLFDDFDYTFIQSANGGIFARVTFNKGFTGGLASDIDFRNLDKTGAANVNIDGMGWTTENEIVMSSANVAAHELGHLVGLRHYDSVGPIGTGLHPNMNHFLWQPTFMGPQEAFETHGNAMSSPLSTGGNFSDSTVRMAFSERSAIKLQFNETGTVVNETGALNNSIANAQALALGNMIVPNTRDTGRYAHLDSFDVDAIAVIGDLNFVGDRDYFSFEANAGDLINIDLISSVGSRYEFSYFDTVVSVLDANGDYVNYYGNDATNDEEMESSDSKILDLVLPEDGTYYIEVMSWFDSDLGNYELFVNRFNDFIPVPEPNATLVVLAICCFCGRRKRTS